MEITEHELAFRSGLLTYVTVPCAHCEEPCQTLWRTDMLEETPSDFCSACHNLLDALRLKTHDRFATALWDSEQKPAID